MPCKRIWITADVHHGIDRDGVGLTQMLADQIRELCGPQDVIVLAGDLGGIDGEGVEECLATFAEFGAQRAFVPGNHDLWVRPSAELDSLERYDRWLPELGRQYGYVMLDWEPLRVPLDQGVLAIAGSYGGYDFTLADLRSISQGPAGIIEGWTNGQFAGMRWNDYKYCLRTEGKERVLLEPAPFCESMATRLEEQLQALEVDPQVRAILTITHTAAHREQVEGHPLQWGRPTSTVEWFTGVAGSKRLGDAIRQTSKARLSFCGHTHHQRQHVDPDGRLWINCGATYLRKCWYSWSLEEGLQHHGWLPDQRPSQELPAVSDRPD